MKFVFDDNKNKHEALDKEDILALLAEAIREGQLPSVDEDTAFVTMLKDPHTGDTHKVAFVTQAQYNQLKADDQLIAGAYYFITDDTTADDLETALAHLTEVANTANEGVNSINNLLDTAHAISEQVAGTSIPEIGDFIKWAYPISEDERCRDGSVFTMRDLNYDWKLFKGIYCGGSFVVAEFDLGGGGGDTYATFHLCSQIGIDDETGEAVFVDQVMASQESLNAKVNAEKTERQSADTALGVRIDDLDSAKSDKPSIIIRPPHQPYYSINERGLYAVNAKDHLGVATITLMLSIDSLTDLSYSATYDDGATRHWAERNNENGRVSVRWVGPSDSGSCVIQSIYLIAKYEEE